MPPLGVDVHLGYVVLVLGCPLGGVDPPWGAEASAPVGTVVVARIHSLRMAGGCRVDMTRVLDGVDETLPREPGAWVRSFNGTSLIQ